MLSPRGRCPRRSRPRRFRPRRSRPRRFRPRPSRPRRVRPRPRRPRQGPPRRLPPQPEPLQVRLPQAEPPQALPPQAEPPQALPPQAEPPQALPPQAEPPQAEPLYVPADQILPSERCLASELPSQVLPKMSLSPVRATWPLTRTYEPRAASSGPSPIDGTIRWLASLPATETSIALAFTRPAPAALGRTPARGVAVDRRRYFTSSGEAYGLACSMSATMPLTNAAAWLVPLPRMNRV